MCPQHSTCQQHQPATPRLSKEAINQLPLARWEGPIHLVRSQQEVAQALSVLTAEDVLGFDTETRPAFKKGQKFLPSLLQLASSQAVFLFQLKQTGLCEELVRILNNSKQIKAGVAPNGDLANLKQISDLHPKGFVDLAPLARSQGINNNGLRGLAAVVCGIRISKSARTSNWANDELTTMQMNYAATDAWIGREIYLRLINGLHTSSMQ